MKTITLTQGQFAIVDDADFERVSQFKWYAGRYPKTWYAQREFRVGANQTVCIKMHNFITGEKQVDHRDGNGLNNTRNNLRPATDAQNGANKKKCSTRKTTSRYKGVVLRAPGKWRAMIRVNWKLLHLGQFDSEEAAARAYDAAAKKYFQEFAHLNF